MRHVLRSDVLVAYEPDNLFERQVRKEGWSGSAFKPGTFLSWISDLFCLISTKRFSGTYVDER